MTQTGRLYKICNDRRITVPKEIADFLDPKHFRSFGWGIDDGKPFIAVFSCDEHELQFVIGRFCAIGKDGKTTVPQQIAKIVDPYDDRRFKCNLKGRRAYLEIHYESKTESEKMYEALQRLDDRDKLRLLENEEKELCRRRTEEIEECERRRKTGRK